MRVTKITAVLVLVLVAGACSSGNDDGESARSDTPPTTKATTTTTMALEPADPVAATAEITAAYEKAFLPGATAAEKLGLVAESDDLAETMDGVVAATPPGVSITIDDVFFTAANKATVTLTVLLDGNPVIPNFKGGAVFEDGIWKVSRKGFCDLALIASITCPTQ